jgi:hypothetical protein
VPDSEDESEEGQKDAVGGPEMNSQAMSTTSAVADQDIPLSAAELPSIASASKPEPTVLIENASVTDTIVRQAENISEQNVFIDITSFSGPQTAATAGEATHVLDTRDAFEYQSQLMLSAALREAIAEASLLSVPDGQPRLQFSGCYSVLIDPSMVLNEEAVDNVAMTLASQTYTTFRWAFKAVFHMSIRKCAGWLLACALQKIGQDF